MWHINPFILSRVYGCSSCVYAGASPSLFERSSTSDYDASSQWRGCSRITLTKLLWQHCPRAHYSKSCIFTGRAHRNCVLIASNYKNNNTDFKNMCHSSSCVIFTWLNMSTGVKRKTFLQRGCIYCMDSFVTGSRADADEYWTAYFLKPQFCVPSQPDKYDKICAIYKKTKISSYLHRIKWYFKWSLSTVNGGGMHNSQWSQNNYDAEWNLLYTYTDTQLYLQCTICI